MGEHTLKYFAAIGAEIPEHFKCLNDLILKVVKLHGTAATVVETLSSVPPEKVVQSRVLRKHRDLDLVGVDKRKVVFLSIKQMLLGQGDIISVL